MPAGLSEIYVAFQLSHKRMTGPVESLLSEIYVVVSTRPDGGAAMGGSLRSSLAGCARLPIHIAMGGYASHGRTSIPGFEVTGYW